MRSRGWMITANTFDEEDIKSLLDIDGWSYRIYGFEYGPITGRFHLHMWFYFQNARTDSSVKKLLPRKYNVTPTNTIGRTIEYIKGYKDGKLKDSENGESCWIAAGDSPREEGSVGRVSQKVENAIKEGKTAIEIKELFPMWYLYHGDKLKRFLEETPLPHKRELYIMRPSDRVQILNELDPGTVSFGIDTYVNEKVLIVDYDYETEWIIDWKNGFPHKVRRGFQVISIDPEIIYLYCKIEENYKPCLRDFSGYLQ